MPLMLSSISGNDSSRSLRRRYSITRSKNKSSTVAMALVLCSLLCLRRATGVSEATHNTASSYHQAVVVKSCAQMARAVFQNRNTNGALRVTLPASGLRCTELDRVSSTQHDIVQWCCLWDFVSWRAWGYICSWNKCVFGSGSHLSKTPENSRQ